MNLTEKKCIPCEGGADPLADNYENNLIQQLKGWEIDRTSVHMIRKVFVLKNFIEAMNFVNEIARIAEKEGHHPDIHIHYKEVTIELHTHAILGLSENDFIVAAKIDVLNR